MNKLLTIGIILLFVGMIVSSSSGFNLEKRSTTLLKGNILYVGGSGPGNYSKIQDAIDNASDGDTIFVYNGTYFENVIVDKSINLIGESKNTTIICNPLNENDCCVKITGDFVNLSGFGIINSSRRPGINMISSRNSMIYNCSLSNNYGCMWIQNSFNISIIKCDIFKSIQEGIMFYNTDNSLIKKCNIYDNSVYGIYTDTSVYNTIEECYFINNSVGIYLDFSSHHIDIRKCKITNNRHTGIRLVRSSYNMVENCIISKSMSGIFFSYNATHNYIFENTITSNHNNGINISEYTLSNYNHIYHNNFINNTENAFDECNNTWDNGYPSYGNYWDDYTGEDKDGDGIGDTPYNITGGDNQDMYPFMKPIINDTIPPVTTVSLKPPYPDGNNDYYVNPVYVTLSATDEGYGVGWIWYRIMGGYWHIVIGSNCTFSLAYDCMIDGLIEYYSVDFFENREEIKSININMDQLPPEGDIEFYTYKEGFWWNVCFNITVWDNCSGLCDRIEFFINDGLQEIIEGSGPEYVFTLQWSETLRNHKGFFYIYDRAGNLLILEVNFSDVESFLYSQSYNIFFWKWLDRFPILNQFIIRIMERWII